VQATQQQYLKTKNEQLPLPANAMSLVVTELTIIAATIWPDPKTKLVEPPRSSSIPCRWNSKEILELIPQGVRVPTLMGLYGFIALTHVDTLLSKFQVSLQTWL
jgi:hypothetical protein